MSKITENINIKEVRNTLFDKLPIDWQEELKFFIKSSDFDDILKFLVEEVQDDRRFTPSLKQLFIPFILCPLNIVQIVFLVPYPSINPTLNTGLSLEITNPEYPGIGYYRLKQDLLQQYPKASCNIREWLKNGCLMMNGSLTSEIGQFNEVHTKKWLPFLYRVIEVLNKKEDIIWVIFGDVEGENKINKDHKIIKVKELPTERSQVWDSENLWIKINDQLKLKNKSEIIW